MFTLQTVPPRVQGLEGDATGTACAGVLVSARLHAECAVTAAAESCTLRAWTNQLFLDAVDAVVLDALTRIGNDPRVMFAFFKRPLAVAKEDAGERARRGPRMLRRDATRALGGKRNRTGLDVGWRSRTAQR